VTIDYGGECADESPLEALSSVAVVCGQVGTSRFIIPIKLVHYVPDFMGLD